MRSRIRFLARRLGRTQWQCAICRIEVDDYLTRCPIQH